MQPDAEVLTDSNAETENFPSTPHHLQPRHSAHAEQGASMAGATALSPASVRPKQRAAMDSGNNLCNTENEQHGSHCSQCMDGYANCVDNCCGTDAAQFGTQHQKTKKAGIKSGSAKRKLKAKPQIKRAPLVMSKCYASAVAPAQQGIDGQTGSVCSYR